MCENFDLNEIKKRADKLEEIKINLKDYFIGLDDIIDKFIDNVKIWYILPEVQSRPLIINLWGMTGLGKTDLVRKFVNLIDFNDKFIEIQMDDGQSYSNNKIQDHIDSVLDGTKESGILLLDEMQRFRTIDEKGVEIRNGKYNDLWMLLSDGKFESDSKNRKDLFEMMADVLYSDDAENHAKLISTDKEVKRERKYNSWSYQAKRLKKILKSDEPVESIMTWSNEKKIIEIQNALRSKVTFEGNVFSKLLIVISGNLDEAFKTAEDVANIDTDADLFYEHSKKINLLNIKNALSKKFKPEQIARFGNVHIIYPSLNRTSFTKIIVKKIQTINENLFEKHCLKINVDDSVINVIYANGVFPTQGVRPVLSTISAIFENSLPHFIYAALLENIDEISIKHNDGFLFSNINGREVKYHISREIEEIKNNKTPNDDALTAIHEAGHAVAYALLFNVVPTQIICQTASDETNGFIGCHNTSSTFENTKKRIIVALSGKMSEKLVFGDDYITSGAASDIKISTILAGLAIRKYGFYNIKSYINTPNLDINCAHNQDINESNHLIEEIIYNSEKMATKLLENNIDFLKKVVKELFEKKELTQIEFAEIAKEFIPSIEILESNKTIETNFKSLMNKFLN